MDGPDDSLSHTRAWDAKVDDPASRGSRQGRAERSSVTNFTRLCERRFVGLGVLKSINTQHFILDCVVKQKFIH